jgi:hypothetical protein
LVRGLPARRRCWQLRWAMTPWAQKSTQKLQQRLYGEIRKCSAAQIPRPTSKPLPAKCAYFKPPSQTTSTPPACLLPCLRPMCFLVLTAPLELHKAPRGCLVTGPKPNQPRPRLPVRKPQHSFDMLHAQPQERAVRHAHCRPLQQGTTQACYAQHTVTPRPLFVFFDWFVARDTDVIFSDVSPFALCCHLVSLVVGFPSDAICFYFL